MIVPRPPTAGEIAALCTFVATDLHQVREAVPRMHR